MPTSSKFNPGLYPHLFPYPEQHINFDEPLETAALALSDISRDAALYRDLIDTATSLLDSHYDAIHNRLYAMTMELTNVVEILKARYGK